MAGKFGVVVPQLEDAAPELELRYLYGTRAETFFHGSWQALRKHTSASSSSGRSTPAASLIGPGPTACDPQGLPGQGGPAARAVARDQEP
jgi:Family of unknown function (DUF6158)